MRFMTTMCALFVLLGGCVAAFAQATRPASAKETITRVYDVRDLTIAVRNFPFTGTMGMPAEHNAVMFPSTGGGSGAEGQALGRDAPPAPRRAREQRETYFPQPTPGPVGPESWRDAGGSVGAV